ncbi:hypothetical protein Tco_0662877 [Tanacetum coccineum]
MYFVSRMDDGSVTGGGHSTCVSLFLSGASIVQGSALSSKDLVAQHTTPPLSVDQAIPKKTDFQREVEVEDSKIVAARERKARATAKKKESRKRDGDEGEGSKPKTKRKKVLAVRKGGSASSMHVSFSNPITTMGHTGNVVGNLSEPGTKLDKLHKNHSVHISPHDSANKFVHNYIDINDVHEETNRLWLGSFVHQSERDLNADKTEVFVSSQAGLHADEGESSRSRDVYIPKWTIPRRCRVDSPMWCRELMVHLAPPAAQEESNALTNPIDLEIAWFSLAQGAMAQVVILERFENLQDDYTKLAKAHGECSDTVRKLDTTRQDLEHNARLYTDMTDRYKGLKEEHVGYVDKFQALEKEKNELSSINRDQALQIRELEVELAKKYSALVYAERISAEGAVEKKKLVTQLSRAEIEKFDCIRKLLPVMVSRLLQSHEYKQSISEPFNMAIQARWSKGLAEECFEKDIMAALRRVENFDL